MLDFLIVLISANQTQALFIKKLSMLIVNQSETSFFYHNFFENLISNNQNQVLLKMQKLTILKSTNKKWYFRFFLKKLPILTFTNGSK